MKMRDRWRRLQKAIGAKAGGYPDSETLGKLEKELGIGALGVIPPTGARFDQRTEKNLKTLLPELQPVFRMFVKEAKAIAKSDGATAKAISGTRTYAEQDALYAQGRTKPGDRVTNARGGYSNHNFGVAIDLGLFDGGSYLDSNDPARATRVYKKIAEKAKALGLLWGGDWQSLKDTPHFEYDTGLTLAKMRERKGAGKGIV